MKDFVNEHWRTILAHNGLTDFDALWDLKADWFEAPNHRRGGWSGVSRCELDRPEGGKVAVFLKRQENHKARIWSHPVHGAPTFLREFKHIMHYRECGVATLEPVYFGMHKAGKDYRAILVTEELTGFVAMEDRVQDWLEHGAPPRKERLLHLKAVATLLRTMHDHGIQHNCYFPKHVFTRINDDGSVDARVIDLEKSRWRPSRTICARSQGSLLSSMCPDSIFAVSSSQSESAWLSEKSSCNSTLSRSFVPSGGRRAGGRISMIFRSKTIALRNESY